MLAIVIFCLALLLTIYGCFIIITGRINLSYLLRQHKKSSNNATLTGIKARIIGLILSFTIPVICLSIILTTIILTLLGFTENQIRNQFLWLFLFNASLCLPIMIYFAISRCKRYDTQQNN